MNTHSFKREQLVPVLINEAWQFFSNPHNLALITPAEMDFKIKSKNIPEIIHEGLQIEYTVKPLFGIKSKWISEISSVNAPYSFVDRQLKGPYSKWIHKHNFISHPSGTLIIDEVEYALPFSFLEGFLHDKIVLKKLNHIFDYRSDKIIRLFSLSDSPAV